MATARKENKKQARPRKAKAAPKQQPAMPAKESPVVAAVVGINQANQVVPGNQTNIAGNVDSGGGMINTGSIQTNGGDVVLRDKNVFYTEEEKYNVTSLNQKPENNPYLGLQAYTYTERDIYAGREAVIETTSKKITTQGAEQVLLFITGVSGSGKSSFVQAGLVPYLEQLYRSKEQTIQWAMFQPTQSPMTQLANALMKLNIPATATFATVEPYLKRVDLDPRDPQQISVLVIDQFEELFVQSVEAEREQFFQLLTVLPEFTYCPLHVLVTMRADYLPDLFPYEALYTIAKQGVELRQMTAEQLKAAITKPLAVRHPNAGKIFEPPLLERLAQDAADDPGCLPLLQVALVDLWQGGDLRLGEYTGLQSALQKRAGIVYNSYKDEYGQFITRNQPEQDLLLTIMVELVNTSLDNNQTRDVRLWRRLNDLEQNDPTRKRLIEELIDERLLVAGHESDSAPTGYDVVTIIHESLIRNWNLLANAVAERRKQLQQSARFELQYREWLANGKNDDYLLTGVRLAEAEELRKANDIALRSTEAQAFIQCSLDIKVAREVEEQRKLTEIERKRADAEADGRRWAQATAAVALALAMALLLIWNFSIIAQQNSLQGAATEYGLLAQQQMMESPIKALALSLKALPQAGQRQPYVPIAEYALTQVLRTLQARTHFTVSNIPLTAARIAVNGQTNPITPMIALGGDGIQLFAKTATAPMTLTTVISPVNGVAWSAAGDLLAYGGNMAAIWAPTQQNSVDALKLMGNVPLTATIACAAWQPATRTVALCTGSDITLLAAPWSAQPEVIKTGFVGNVIGLEWAKNGYLAAYDDFGGFLYLDSAHPDHKVLAPEDHYFEITDLAWSDNNDYVVVGTFDGFVDIWPTDLITSTTQPITVPSCSGYTGVDFVAADEFMSWSAKGTPLRWKVNGTPSGHDGVPLCLTDPAAATIENLIQLADGNRLIARSDGNAEIIDAQGENSYLLVGHERTILSARLSPNQKYLATGSQDGTARIWELATRQLITTLRRHGAPQSRSDVLLVQWLDDHNVLSIGEDGTLRTWAIFDDDGDAICWGTDEAELPRCVDPNSTLVGHTDTIAEARWLKGPPDQYMIGSVGRDGTARLWVGPTNDIAGVSAIKNTITYSLPESTANAFWLTTDKLLLSDQAGAVRIVNPASGQTQFGPVQYGSLIVQAVFANDRLVTGDKNGQVVLWAEDLSTHPPIYTFTQTVDSLEWRENSTTLLATGGDVVLLDTTGRSEPWVWPNPQTKTKATLSADERYIAITFGHHSLVVERSTEKKLWENDRDSLNEEPFRGGQWVSGEPWPYQSSNWWNRWGQPDGRKELLLLWTGDGTVQLWNWREEQEIMRLTEHASGEAQGPISYAAASDDGRYILTLTENSPQSAMRLWRAWPRDPVALLATADQLRAGLQQ